MQDSVDVKTPPDGPLLRGRYRAISRLGHGAQGTLHLAEDIQTGAKVAVKELNLEFVEEWKAIELFEREGRALESLDHPSIPDYVDAFHEASKEGTEKFYLVQEYMEGTPLSERIEAGELFDEEQAREFLIEMLQTLDYLASLNPPVVHRDIKPSNIIVRSDGTHSLVDFGAVQTLVAETVGGSTVVGTTGFMPPEQLMGRATPASDIYGLGATVLKAMTGIDPADFEKVRMKLVFGDRLHASQPFTRVLERMLEPDVDLRFQSGTEVIEVLVDPSRLSSMSLMTRDPQLLQRWEAAETRIDQLQHNPPEAPLSKVHVSPHELSISVGPVKSTPGCGLPTFFLCVVCGGLLAIASGVLGMIIVPTLGLAVLLASRRKFGSVAETLRVNADEIVIEQVWNVPMFGQESETQRLETGRASLPYVYRLGSQRGGGQDEHPTLNHHALIVPSVDGRAVAFGSALSTGNGTARPKGTNDGRELYWLEAVVSEYLKYLRGQPGQDIQDGGGNG